MLICYPVKARSNFNNFWNFLNSLDGALGRFLAGYYLSMHSMLSIYAFSDQYFLQPPRWRLRFLFTTELMFCCCCCCCCCYTSCVQLKSLKLCISPCYPKTLKYPLQHSLTPSTLISRCSGGDESRYLLTFSQELHALACTATADCSKLLC